MNAHSEFILGKMVDHFGRWEEPVEKKKKRKNIRQTSKMAVQKQKKKTFTNLVSYEDEQVRQRRDEMLSFIEEMNSLEKHQHTYRKNVEQSQIKTRQEELIYVKEFLKEEMQAVYFIQAS